MGAAKGCAKSFVQVLKPLLENVQTIFKGLTQFIKSVFLRDWKSTLNGLKTIANGALAGLGNIIKAPFKLISQTVKGVISSFKSLSIVKSIFTAVGNAGKNVLSKTGINLKTFSSNVKNIKVRINNILKTLKATFNIVFGAIINILKNAKRTIFAFKVAAVAAFVGVKLIIPVIKIAFSTISGAVVAAVNIMISIISSFSTLLDGVITFITGVFTGNWRKAWEGIKTIFKGVFDSLVALCKTPINAVIGIINGAIEGINSLKVSIPDWVPGVGGKSFGVNLPTIPMLYKGTDNWQGGTAIIHDRGGEIVDLPKGTRVYPHDKSIEMARRDGASQGKSGNVSINIQKLADKIEVRSDDDIDRIAEALALKLKKVAFNMA